MTAIGEFIATLRTSRQLSLSKLAELAQVGKRTLSYWEQGDYEPRLPELTSVLSALGATAEQHAQAVALLTGARGHRQVRRSLEYVHRGTNLERLPSGGDLLRTLRHRRGLHLEQVAALMGISGTTVSRWESGHVVPPPERLDTLLSVLGAREGERTALKDGYLFLLMPQKEAPPSAADLQESFHAFISSLYGNREDKLNDLRFLSYEAQAWSLATKDAHGQEILASVYANYAAFLAGFHRLEEACRYAYRTLDLLAHSPASKDILLRAAIIAARTEVYRGQRPAPKRGLKMLQSWRSADSPLAYQAWMLSEMAEYLMLENNGEVALRLHREACQIAERCQNPDELRLRKLDLAKVEIMVGNAEHGLSLVTLSARDSPFRRADIELLFAEGLTALKDTRNAQIWLDRATVDIQTYDLTHLQKRAYMLAKQF